GLTRRPATGNLAMMENSRRTIRNEIGRRSFLNGPLPWLAYLPFYVLPWLWQPPTRLAVIAAVIGLAVFLPVYLTGYRATGMRLLASSCIVMAVAAALATLGGNWTVYAIYAAAMAGGLRSTRLAGWMIGGIAVLTATLGVALSQPLLWWLPGVLLVVTTGFSVIQREAIHDRNEALLLAQEEVRRLSRTAERERITRDLHDVVGRTLTLIALKSDIAVRLSADDPAAAAEEMRNVAGAAREGLGELRAALAGVAGGSLAREAEVSRGVLAAAGVVSAFEGDPESVPPDAGAVLAMTLREAVTNVIRHAGAGHCHMAISILDGVARLTVEDDGCGGSFSEGTGLGGMRQRLTAAGGSLSLERAAPGTRLAAMVPSGAI
ncbi:MAG: histidine kinase, partial [Sphingomonas sp.]